MSDANELAAALDALTTHPSLTFDERDAARNGATVVRLAAAWLEIETGIVPPDVLSWATEVTKRRNALRDALRSGG